MASSVVTFMVIRDFKLVKGWGRSQVTSTWRKDQWRLEVCDNNNKAYIGLSHEMELLSRNSAHVRSLNWAFSGH